VWGECVEGFAHVLVPSLLPGPSAVTFRRRSEQRRPPGRRTRSEIAFTAEGDPRRNLQCGVHRVLWVDLGWALLRRQGRS
jgi:hypothetical protein